MGRFDIHAHIHDFDTWDAETALDEQSRFGIDTQVLSVPLMPESPRYYPGAAGRTSREVNQRLAGIVAKAPERFGAFGVVPGDQAADAVREARFAIEELGLDGLCLLTHSRGRYLGDSFYEEVLGAAAELGVPVLLHPMINSASEALALGRPGFLLEVVFDTARSVTDGVYSGVLDRLPGLDLVLAHAGGALPALAWRIASMTGIGRRPNDADVTADSVRAALGRLWYDVGLACGHATLAAVLKVAGPERLLFGSDLGAAPYDLVTANVNGLTSYDFTDAELSRIEGGNARPLFRRFR